MYKIIATLDAGNIVTGIKQVKAAYILTGADLEVEVYDASILGRLWDGSNFIIAAPDPINYGTKITKRAFSQRLTPPERIAIRNSTDDIIIDIQADLALAEYVDLSDLDTFAAIQYLIYVEILTEARGNEIINSPVEEGEV